MGLRHSNTSPCLFFGHLIDGEPPIYIGIYVDDIIYFSASDKVERYFESSLSTIGTVEFMGQVSHFLGNEFNWVYHPNGHISVSLTQQSFAETLVESQHLMVAGTSTLLHHTDRDYQLMLSHNKPCLLLIETHCDYNINL
jgi:hypothetical protein